LSTSLLEEKVAQIAINLAKASLDEFIESHQPPITSETSTTTPLGESTDGEEKEKELAAHFVGEGVEYPVTVHVGYWLEGDGRKVLEEECGYKRPLVYILYLALKAYPHLFFFASITMLTWLLMLWLYTILPEGLGMMQFLLAALCLFMLANDTAIGLVNQIVTRFVFDFVFCSLLIFLLSPLKKGHSRHCCYRCSILLSAQYLKNAKQSLWFLHCSLTWLP